MQLELRHLRTLCAIADAGSLSRAAAAVGVSQPALTAQLQRIETVLGGQVFQRDRRGVSPTPFGLFVLSRARSALVTVDELTAGAAADGNPARLRIGGNANAVLTRLLHKLFEIPGTRVTVHTEYSPRLLLDLLASRRLDVAVLVDYPGHELPAVPAVGTHHIATEPVFVALPAAHRLAAADEVRLADLAAEDWLVTPPDGAGWPEVFYSACQDAGFAPRVLHMMSEQDMIRTLVGDGRAIAPCQATLRAGPGIAVRPLAGSPLRMRHLLGWRHGGALGDRAAVLAGLAVEAYREAAADSPAYTAWLARTDTALTDTAWTNTAWTDTAWTR
ncbi:LysR family transcriptional regulator [Actinomadura fibrosa]|uniref:LysR family transcriptional regulator n=1 Tax=Actinomadura fibrosa TaxID=111802 RepID=A0ABW2XG56_9ACTN|nr:LysR family transcriptional regulator [Actinomadura fibrosa]